MTFWFNNDRKAAFKMYKVSKTADIFDNDLKHLKQKRNLITNTVKLISETS